MPLGVGHATGAILNSVEIYRLQWKKNEKDGYRERETEGRGGGQGRWREGEDKIRKECEIPRFETHIIYTTVDAPTRLRSAEYGRACHAIIILKEKKDLKTVKHNINIRIKKK